MGARVSVVIQPLHEKDQGGFKSFWCLQELAERPVYSPRRNKEFESVQTLYVGGHCGLGHRRLP